MRAGKLNKRIDFYSLSTVQDEYLGTTESFKKEFSCWAEVRYTGGGETMLNEQVFPMQRIEFYIRYRSSITETMRIKYSNNWYNILYVEQIGGEKDGLRIVTAKVSE